MSRRQYRIRPWRLGIALAILIAFVVAIFSLWPKSTPPPNPALQTANLDALTWDGGKPFSWPAPAGGAGSAERSAFLSLVELDPTANPVQSAGVFSGYSGINIGYPLRFTVFIPSAAMSTDPANPIHAIPLSDGMELVHARFVPTTTPEDDRRTEAQAIRAEFLNGAIPDVNAGTEGWPILLRVPAETFNDNRELSKDFPGAFFDVTGVIERLQFEGNPVNLVPNWAGRAPAPVVWTESIQSVPTSDLLYKATRISATPITVQRGGFDITILNVSLVPGSPTLVIVRARVVNRNPDTKAVEWNPTMSDNTFVQDPELNRYVFDTQSTPEIPMLNFDFSQQRIQTGYMVFSLPNPVNSVSTLDLHLADPTDTTDLPGASIVLRVALVEPGSAEVPSLPPMALPAPLPAAAP